MTPSLNSKRRRKYHQVIGEAEVLGLQEREFTLIMGPDLATGPKLPTIGTALELSQCSLVTQVTYSYRCKGIYLMTVKVFPGSSGEASKEMHFGMPLYTSI